MFKSSFKSTQKKLQPKKLDIKLILALSLSVIAVFLICLVSFQIYIGSVIKSRPPVNSQNIYNQSAYNQRIKEISENLKSEKQIVKDVIMENDFIASDYQVTPEFIKKIKTSDKINMRFRYDSENVSFDGFFKQYIMDEDNNKYPLLSSWGFNEYPIFSLRNKKTSLTGGEGYSVEYIGIKMNDINFVKRMRAEFSTFYYSGCGSRSSKEIKSFFKISNALACEPPMNIVPAGTYDMELYDQSEDIYWYRLKKPMVLNDNNSIMNVLYKPDGKEGAFQLQLINIILKGPNGDFYQPTIEYNFNHYYKAYFKHSYD